MIAALIESAKLILGFLPWFLFLFLPTDSWDRLRGAVVICLAASVLFSWKMLRKGFILQWATVAFFLFCALSLYGFRWVWLADHMGIIANGFLDGIIWFTVLTGKPFTLQYARAELPQEQWNDEGLIHSCRFIAIFWGMLLLVPIASEAFRLFYPHALPGRFSLFLSLSCIAIGSGYTMFYKHLKRRQREAMEKLSIAP
ncbi:MAG: hypothetical protein WC840_00530 [Candidatus Peribacteraceae bacterium]